MIRSSNKWATVPLGTLTEFRNGINYNKDNFGKGIKVVNVRNFQNHSIATLDDLDEVNPAGLIKKEDLLRENDIIFVRSNGNRELIGRSLFIPSLTEKITHSAFTIRVRFTSEKALPRFYAYLFRSSLIRETLSAQGNGTNISNLNQGILSNLEVPLPNLEAQRRIIDILSAYDDLIENNTRRIKILESMAQLLYREWFVNFRFPGHQQVPMVESELGLIPQGWEVKKLSDVTSVITKGTTPTTLKKSFVEQGINFLKVESLSNDGGIIEEKLAKIDPETHTLLKRSQLQTNDILFSIAGAIGRTTLIPSRILPANTNQALAIIRSLEDVFVPYLYQTIRSSRFLNFSLGRVVQTAQANVSLSVLSAAPVLVPTAHTLNLGNQFLTPIIRKVDLLREKNLNLQKTRDLLLPKLISGEIDVESLDSATETDLEELAA